VTEAQAIVQIRQELDDNIDTTSTNPPPSHQAIDEPVLQPVDGVNNTFRVRHRPLIGSTPSFTLVVRNQLYAILTTTSVDPVTGIFTLTSVPAAGVTLFGTYQYAFATDGQYSAWLSQACRFLSVTTVPNVVDGLQPAMFAFVKYLYFLFLATKSGDFFDSTVGGKTVSLASVPARYFSMATETKAEAFKLRDDYYQTQGQQFRPSYGFVAPRQVRYTPPR
jgi:hypothetical protein